MIIAVICVMQTVAATLYSCYKIGHMSITSLKTYKLQVKFYIQLEIEIDAAVLSNIYMYHDRVDCCIQLASWLLQRLKIQTNVTLKDNNT